MQVEAGLQAQDLLSTLAQLRPGLEAFARECYGPQVAVAAWRDFSRWGLAPIARDEQAYQAAFSAWYLYTWLPDDSGLEQGFARQPPDAALAFEYLQSRSEPLGTAAQALIETACAAHYSFYGVEALGADGLLKLRDLYTGELLRVYGEAVARAEGEVIYASVLSLNGMAVLLGCMPEALSAAAGQRVEAHREKWRLEEGRAIDRRALYLHDSELRRFYFVLLHGQHRAGLH